MEVRETTGKSMSKFGLKTMDKYGANEWGILSGVPVGKSMEGARAWARMPTLNMADLAMLYTLRPARIVKI